MGVRFNADEVFEMAIRIEKNGADFYRKAGELQSDEKIKDFFGRLVAMEQQHIDVFEDMRASLTEADRSGEVYDPDEELSYYLESMADAHGGEGDPSTAHALTGNESLENILKTAIGLEKQSILFYTGLKDMVPPKQGRGRIQTIIEEETKHVSQLAGVLEQTQAGGG